jgi:DNA polymerase/3'-5' exonuclease PolX
MLSPDKPRYPREAALEVARELCRALKPVTTRLIVAGSLRRRATTVGDVEILYIPRTEPRQIDLLTHGPASLADDVLNQLLADGTITRRLNKNGSATWGAANKLAVHTRSSIPVDLFETTEASWWNYLVCRTGPATSNTRIAIEARMHGYRWNPYASGFTSLTDGTATPAMTSEQDVFAFVHLPYCEPWDRV